MSSYPNVNAANKYAREVVSGKIDACKYVRQACQRHLDDLEKQKDKSFKYKFNKDKAERVCKFQQLLVHTKGKWKKKGVDQSRIVLEPWQLFIYVAVYGWVKKKNGKRRFKEVYTEVPRKNGKSILAAGIGLYMLCADGENAAEVYCGAGSEKQAWMVFEPAKKIVDRLTNLKKRFSIKSWAKSLIRPDGSKFEPVIGDPGDGASPHCGIVDEFHEHPTADLYETLLTGMGAREQPLMWVITTAGFDLESPCFDMRERVIEMLDGVSDDDSLFGIIYTIDPEDDWDSETALRKANPNYGISVEEDFLLEQLNSAKNRPRFTNAFKTKHLNIWVTAKQTYFNLDKWKACEDKTLTLEQFKDEHCYLGLDCARKIDLNSMSRLFVREIDGRKHYYSVGPKFYIPYDTVYEPESKRVGERYGKYVNKKVLSVCDGAEVDYRYILEDMKQCAGENPVLECPIDPSGATALSHSLDDEGLNPVTITQSYTNLSDPMKELEAAIAAGRFHHDGNPIMTWCISNVIGKHMPGNDDVVRPIKQKSENKIDGAVALMMAIGRAMLNESTGSVYDDEEVGV